VRFVDHVELLRRERGNELLGNGGLHSHDVCLK
jgi:hypothetical protein